MYQYSTPFKKELTLNFEVVIDSHAVIRNKTGVSSGSIFLVTYNHSSISQPGY